MKKLLFGLLLFAGLGASPALAGSTTFPLQPCTSGCTNQGVTTDGSSNIYPNTAIVDGAAAANKAGVDSSGGLTIKGEGTAGTPAGGVLTIQGGSGGTAVPAALNTTPSIANGNGVVLTQSGNAVAAGNPTFAALSIGGAVNAVGNPIFVGLSIGGSSVGNANGIYSNLLQGNSALSASNGIYANILQGNAALSSGNPIFAQMTAGSATIGKTDTLGNAGAAIDFAGQNATSPANSWQIGGQFNTTPTTITSGNSSPLQLDNAGNLLVNVKAGGGSGGTSSNFSATFPSTGTAAGAEYLSSAPTLTSGQMVALQVTSAGSLHATVDNTNANVANNADSIAPTTNVASPVANYGFGFDGANWDRVRVNTSGQQVIVGAGTAGTPSGGVTSIQGVSSGTPVSVSTSDPCTSAAKTNVAISTATGTTQLVAPSGSTQVYICSIFTIGATASIQNLVGGTGATCTTGTPVAIAGSTTAANGMSFAANGGFTFGNGGGTVMRTTTAGHGVCLIQSATAQISGNITYVQQ